MEICPLCNDPGFKLIYTAPLNVSGAEIVQCNHCFHVYTRISSAAGQEELYSTENYEINQNRNGLLDTILNRENNSIIKKLKRLNKSGTRLLDFGSGKGRFAGLAKKAGWEVKGVETAPERAEYARKSYGVETSSDFYTDGKIFTWDFDVITLFHVLEHLPDPQTLLRNLVENNLKPGGLLIVEVPNFHSWQRKIAGKSWLHLDPTRHVHHFIPDELDKLSLRLGFTLISSDYYSFHLGVLGMTDSFLKLLGFRKNIIYELKHHRSFPLMIGIALILPFALVTEAIAALSRKGGIVRKYYRK